MTDAHAISVEGLGKVFQSPAGVREMLRGRLFGRPVTALSDVSFTVRQGEIVCVMGPNGAGKSTLVRILGGLLLPSSGRARVAGIDAGAGTSEFRQRVAFVVGDERSFHFRVSGRGNLHYFAALHGLTPSVARQRAGELLARVGLAEAADRRYREYSRGMRQRLAIARGLLGDPKVLLLDEPTLGLDPKGARDLRAFLREEIIRGAGRTAIVCSNDPTEARAMADRVLFLDGGRLHAEASPDRIEAELGLWSVSAFSPPWFLRVLVAFIRRELAALGGYRTAFVIRILGFGLAVCSLLFLSRFVGAAVNPHLAAYRGNYLGFVVLGFLGTEFQQVGVSVLAQRIRMAQVMGTLEAEVATPAPPWMVLGAPPVYEFATAALRSAAYLLGAKLLLGLDLSHANWVSLLVSVPLIIAAFSGFGLLAAATTMLVRRLNPVAMVIGSLSFFLSGVMYPVSVLPEWLRAVGRLLPLTHALAVLRGALLVGSGLGELRSSLLALLVFAGLLAPIGAGMFAFALRRARVDGSLSHY